VEDEDCHTKIEDYLTEHYGEIGKKYIQLAPETIKSSLQCVFI